MHVKVYQAVVVFAIGTTVVHSDPSTMLMFNNPAFQLQPSLALMVLVGFWLVVSLPRLRPQQGSSPPKLLLHH